MYEDDHEDENDFQTSGSDVNARLPLPSHLRSADSRCRDLDNNSGSQSKKRRVFKGLSSISCQRNMKTASERSYPRLISQAKRTKSEALWQLPARFRRRRRENTGKRLIRQPDMESK